MGLFSKPEAYLGIDIGAHGIKLVELHKTKNRPQLWTYGILNQPLDIHLQYIEETKKITAVPDDMIFNDPRIDKYAGYLRELLKTSRATTKRATSSLPVSYVFHAVVTLPKMDEKDIDNVLKAEVNKMLSRPAEQMQIVYQKIPESDFDKKSKYIRFLVTAAPKELVKFYSLIFQRAGLELQELETEAFALERSLVGRDQAISMVVDIGAERTNFFVMDQGLPLTHRSINIGGDTFDKKIIEILGAEPSIISQIKTDISKYHKNFNYEIFLPIIDSFIKEIKYSLDLYTHQASNQDRQPEKIILTGGASVMPFIKEEIKKNFPLKVFVGDPWARVVYQDSVKPVLDNIGPRMSVSIGLALRNIV